MGLENRHNCTGDVSNHSDFCIHMKNNEFQNEKQSNGPNTVVTNNAGLGFTADVLEEIYTNKDFPSNAPSLDISLAESGKSRADFWTFASYLAVEWGVERNNNGCDGEDTLGDVVRKLFDC